MARLSAGGPGETRCAVVARILRCFWDMNHKHENTVRTDELLCLVCLVALAGATLTGCDSDILEGLETPCSRADLNCGDGNPCTRDYCANYIDVFDTGVSGPMCEHDPTNDGEECGFDQIALTCRGGLCGAAQLCEGVVCRDDNLCTDDTCAWDGECVFAPVSCDDGDLCTNDRCDPNTGRCDFTTPSEDGTYCLLDAVEWKIGGCEAGVCAGPCDPDSEEEVECPVEFFLTTVCCPGSEACLPDCSSGF